MEDKILLKKLEELVKEKVKKEVFLKELIKSELFMKYPKYRLAFNSVIMAIHNLTENVFDRIIRCYVRPKQKDESLYDDAVITYCNTKLCPEEVRGYIIFNFGFEEKKNLIHKVFGLSKKTKNLIEKLNVIRNAIAHRYDENDQRYFYKKQNVVENCSVLVMFIEDYFLALKEILRIDTRLLDGLDKAEKEFDLL
ncbi:MAG: hypothetical protein KJ915_08990 [Candidatus Omnitrophica bacterium]|nr:hypothetical protein [Candidatus Omnitrophota bacterium]